MSLALESFLAYLGYRGFIDRLVAFFTGGEFIVGFVAFTLHLFIQITSVISKHISVAFNIKPQTTGIYFTKMFSLRGLVTLSASLFCYLLKLYVDEDNVAISIVFAFFVLISRLVFMVCLTFSAERAVHIYNVFVLDAISVGLFQMTFYSLTANYVSILSISFKLSKITVFIVQMMLDIMIPDDPMTMVFVHYWFGFVLTGITTILWLIFCVRKSNEKCTDKDVKQTGTGEIEGQHVELQVMREKEVKDCEALVDKKESCEPSFLELLRRAASPFMMCLVTLAMKVLLYPGVLPYGLLARDKCHVINMAINPAGLVGSTTVHILRSVVSSINQRWDWCWHLIWLMGVPPAIIFVMAFVALHIEGVISRLVLDNQIAVFAMAVMFFLFHSLIESAGYLGVVANVKHKGKMGERGRKVVSTNQLSGEIFGFIFYKLAIGYNVTRAACERNSWKFYPALQMTDLAKVLFWLKSIFKTAFHDFIKDFSLNIREYV